MKTTINLNTKIQLTVNQLINLTKQLPKKDKLKLASILLEEEDNISKEELMLKLKEALADVKLHNTGKIKLRSLDDFLTDV